MKKIQETQANPSTSSESRLSLRRERMKALTVRSGIQTGFRPASTNPPPCTFSVLGP
jgi:hypothetical protein